LLIQNKKWFPCLYTIAKSHQVKDSCLYGSFFRKILPMPDATIKNRLFIGKPDTGCNLIGYVEMFREAVNDYLSDISPQL
jgi:hypothetical protein